MRSFAIKPQVSAGRSSNGDMSLLDLLDVLKRGKWSIAFWTVICGLIGGLYAFQLATPLYTAKSTVSLQSRQESIVDLASPVSALGNDLFTINTEVETLQSRGLATKLVDKLNLVENPIFNKALRERTHDPDAEPDMLSGVLAGLGFTSGDEDQGPARTEEEQRDFERTQVIGQLLKALDITNEKYSFVFHIEATTTDAATSARIANGLAEAYVEDQIAIKYEATQQATAWLTSRVADLEQELEEAENKVKAYNATTDLLDPAALEILNRQLKDRRDRIADARTAARLAEEKQTRLETALASGDRSEMATIAQDTRLDQYSTRLNVPEIQTAFDQYFTRILERARFEARQSATTVATLVQSIAELEGQVEQQSGELLKLEQLEREAAASRQIYEYFLSRLKEISVQQGIHSADSRILSLATVPRFPSAPRTAIILAVTMFMGMLLGMALVLMRELRQNGFRAAQDLEAATGISVLAQIPSAPVTRRRRLLRYLETKPASALAEAVRNLRTSVILSNVDKPPQVIMITSSLPGEGKTTQSMALAQSFASMGRKVLLIEGDIRRRVFREIFRLDTKSGLIKAITQDLALSEVVHHSEELGIDVLAGERSTVNAADFFSSGRVKTFIDRARAEYDIILIDTPPVLVVPDARVIGQLADTVLYVVHWNRTTRVQVEEGLNAFASVDIQVAGLVLSQINIRKAAYYGGRYREIYAAYDTKYYRN